jgi:hypothetical protein
VRVVCDRTLHALADPQVAYVRTCRGAIELLDGAVEPQGSFLDQVEEGDAEPAVALRDRHDEPEVRLDHAALRAQVSALDRLRKDNLLVRGQQLVLPDVGEEELQAVARAGGCVGLVHDRLGLRLLLALLEHRLADFQSDALQLLYDVFLACVVRSFSTANASSSAGSIQPAPHPPRSASGRSRSRSSISWL